MSGVANMAKGIASIAKLKSAMRELPIRVRADVAREAAPVLNRLLHSDFDAGRTVYGDARPLGVDGKPLDLTKSGKTRATLNFVSVGTILRVQLGTKYARYLVGKYKVLPTTLPAAYRGELEALVRSHVEAFQREAMS